MTEYLFVLGRTPRLAFAELHSLFPHISLITEEVAYFVDRQDTLNVSKLMNILGGTIKIARIIGQTSEILPSILAAHLLKQSEDTRIIFGVSSYDPRLSITTSFLRQIKVALENHGIHARFIEAQQSRALTSVVVDKQHVKETIIVSKNHKYIMGQTVAVQRFEDWNNRDYGRPYADAKHGMLPLKVARMALNIALGLQSQGKKISDPFCGMGSILGEALVLGCRVFGSDTSKDAIYKTKKNIEWLFRQIPETLRDVSLHICDAVHLSTIIDPLSLDAIVTEPFMGHSNLVNSHKITGERNTFLKIIKNQIRGLEKLYIGCFKDWHSVLKPSGVVCIVFPEYSFGERTFSVKKVVDMCENLGYTKLLGPIEYFRPQAVVKREFYLFQKKYGSC